MINHGFVKVASAIPLCNVGDVDFNCMEISNLIKKAYHQKAQIIVFPELSVTGYSCGDLLLSSTLTEGALQGISYVLEETKNIDIISIVGLPIYDGAHLLNCAAVLHKGKILGIVTKTYIPNYSEFYESRWFLSGERSVTDTLNICNQTVPLSSNIVFDCGNFKFAVEICEDMWVATPPSIFHSLNGAQIIFNLSATNAVVGKAGFRNTIIKQRSYSSHCAYVFVSASISESTTDTLYSSNTIVGENGSIILEETNFSFESKIYYSEIDIDRLNSERRKRTTFDSFVKSEKPYKFVKVDTKAQPMEKLERKISAYPFVPRQSANSDKRMQEIYDILSFSLAKRLKHTNIKNPVIGISGGLDSTLALLVTVRAMDILNLPRTGVEAITMPGFGTTSRTLENARELMKHLGVSTREISIIPACKQHFKDIGHDINSTDVTYENSQARERTQILMDISNQIGGMVIGTGDLSELALGWATYGGDHISMYGINSGVPKTLVRHLTSWIANKILTGEVQEVVKDIVATPVSPELLPADKDGEIAQKTEDIIGDYALHDFFIYYFIRFGYTPKKILFLAEHAFEGVYNTVQIKKALILFLKRFFGNQFKRNCMPDGPKIGSITLSPRTDWRMPSDATVNLWLKNLE